MIVQKANSKNTANEQNGGMTMRKFYINGEEVKITTFWSVGRYLNMKETERLQNGKTVKKGNKEFRIEEEKKQEENRMEKNEMKALIEKAAAEYGFETEQTTWSEMPQIKRTNESYVSIDIRDFWVGFDAETKTAKRAIEVNCSVCRMGGAATPQELMAAAEEIRRGAELTEKLQSMNLEYTEEV